ncbi:hypothetical protein KHP60_23680 [Microvirga sp. 3-52]|uniref:hypothetical protein n=1 Tax=Microvirga sp. 3-52 TaxID=2792425 RepID=UPI001AC691C6|nr:hypothetical protein [Microvirga sp. 3-52]MBO1908650.1 hypothetical protein [Microvirga sp. 3-52]MBS7455301.1 hypothetical protein [Microvirga sp. 3-52]
MKRLRPEQKLDHVLANLAQDIVDAADPELGQAASGRSLRATLTEIRTIVQAAIARCETLPHALPKHDDPSKDQIDDRE